MKILVRLLFASALNLIASTAFANSAPPSLKYRVTGIGYVPLRFNDVLIYSRDLKLKFDASRKLISAQQGFPLQGYVIDTEGKQSDHLSSISLANIVDLPVQTTEISCSINLNALAEVQPFAFDAGGIELAANTSNYNFAQTIFGAHSEFQLLSFFFKKDAANQWSYYVLNQRPRIVASGKLSFNADGSLRDAVADHVLDEVNTDYSFKLLFPKNLVTQYASNFGLWKFDQNGRPTGTFLRFRIEKSGSLVGTFSNGIQRDLYKIPIAKFDNENFLFEFVPNVFVPTDLSGPAKLGAAQIDGRGEIIRILKP